VFISDDGGGRWRLGAALPGMDESQLEASPAATDSPGRLGAVRLSALSVFLCKSIFYDAFVWDRRALNSQKRRFPARAV
jgi:hypothetical protein